MVSRPASLQARVGDGGPSCGGHVEIVTHQCLAAAVEAAVAYARHRGACTRSDLACDEGGHVGQPVGVTPFVVVPRKDLYQAFAEHLGERRVENG